MVDVIWGVKIDLNAGFCAVELVVFVMRYFSTFLDKDTLVAERRVTSCLLYTSPSPRD